MLLGEGLAPGTSPVGPSEPRIETIALVVLTFSAPLEVLSVSGFGFMAKFCRTSSFHALYIPVFRCAFVVFSVFGH